MESCDRKAALCTSLDEGKACADGAGGAAAPPPGSAAGDLPLQILIGDFHARREPV